MYCVRGERAMGKYSDEIRAVAKQVDENWNPEVLGVAAAELRRLAGELESAAQKLTDEENTRRFSAQG